MEQETNPQPQMQSEQSTVSTTLAPTVPISDDAVADHKLFAIIGYILPFLFFVPMVQDSSKNNAFARFHANQQLSLLAVCVGVYVLGLVIYSISYMLVIFIPLLNLGILALAIMGIIHAAQGEMKGLPLIGKLNFLDMVFAKK